MDNAQDGRLEPLKQSLPYWYHGELKVTLWVCIWDYGTSRKVKRLPTRLVSCLYLRRQVTVEVGCTAVLRPTQVLVRATSIRTPNVSGSTRRQHSKEVRV